VIDVQDNVLPFLRLIIYWDFFVTIVTTGAIFSLKFTKNRLAAGLRPDPLGELTRSPDPLAAKTRGLLLRGGEEREGDRMGGKGRGREGEGGTREEGRGKERKGWKDRVGGRWRKRGRAP